MHIIDLVIVFGWLAFWVYWIISAMGSKRSLMPARSQYMRFRLIIFVIVLLILRLTINSQINLNVGSIVNHDYWLAGAGLVLFVSGLCLAIWARIYLGKNWGMPMSLKQEPELVTSGPYHFVRHPIYSGILLATLGSVMASSFYWLVILVFFGVYFIYSATVEEKNMLKQFPATYPNYKKQTKMLIPFLF